MAKIVPISYQEFVKQTTGIPTYLSNLAGLERKPLPKIAFEDVPTYDLSNLKDEDETSRLAKIVQDGVEKAFAGVGDSFKEWFQGILNELYDWVIVNGIQLCKVGACCYLMISIFRLMANPTMGAMMLENGKPDKGKLNEVINHITLSGFACLVFCALELVVSK